MNETLYWIMLAGIFGPANQNIWKLMNTCGTPEEGYRKVSDGRFQLTEREKNQFALWTPEKAAVTAEMCIKKNIKIITFSDADYPSKLKTIFNPPALLYAYGDVSCLNDEITLGVVGTRSPSQYGYDAAFRISEELAKVGFTIVSGFAAGIDSAAHRGTLQGGGKTIAVLGCGTDRDYPLANRDIREAVAENGVLVSEYPPGTTPNAINFPMRNRIISGLSLGVFVAEAPLKSGALITAEQAIEQGRDIFCLPPSDIFSKSYQGVVKYLRDGAVPVFSHLDIIYEYFTTFSHKLSPVKPSDEYIVGRTESFIYSDSPGKPAKTKPGTRKITEEKVSAPDPSDFIKKFSFSEDQKKIADVLVSGPHHFDEIADISALSASDLLMEISEMEISGAVISMPGKVYRLNL